MALKFDNVLIVADLEGSSGCWNRRAASFMTDEWSRACVEMTHDVNAVVETLFGAGVKRVTVKDFHRTAYNLLPERMDPRAQLVSGYKHGPVLGLGDPGEARAAMFIGMHAGSGTDGFLAHTLTSRIQRLEVNGRLLMEVELFSASLAAHAVRPVFYSGCPVACAQAKEAIAGIHAYPIDKSTGPEAFNANRWRSGLANAAVESLDRPQTKPHAPTGPFRAVITMRHGETAARKLARKWDLVHDGERIFVDAHDLNELYRTLVRLCYLTPLAAKMLPVALSVNNIKGRIGLEWVRRRLRLKR